MNPPIGQDLRRAALAAGADLVGVTELAPFKSENATVPPDLLASFTHGVSLAIRLDHAALDRIDRGPTVEYADHYREVNARLDRASGELVEWIRGRGHAARAIPASGIADEEHLLGAISHRAVARMAGIGWQGKSLLIVSPRYGPRIRLTTVLTDLASPTDVPQRNRCGSCSICARACPAGAIKNVPTTSRYHSRAEAIHLGRCAAFTRRFKEQPGIGASICGVCVAVCPWGKKR